MRTLPAWMGLLQLEPITSLNQLQDLRSEWSRLWETSLTGTPFQSPEWLLPWWQHLGGGELFVLALRQDGRLIGLAPLFMHEWNGRRQISPLGVSHSDYTDFLLSDASGRDAVQMIFEYLAEVRSRWDIIDLPDVREGSPLLDATVPECLNVRVEPSDVCPVLVLPPGLSEFETGLSAHHRRNLRRAEKLMEQFGPFGIEQATEQTLSEMIDALYRLHETRWREMDEPGVLHEPPVQAFHREVISGFWHSGALRLYGLRQNGVITAVMYDFAGAGRVYAYLGGFDPRLDKASPGTLLTFHAIQKAIRDGCREYDFLRGAEKHKYVWGAADRQNYRMLIGHSSRTSSRKKSR